MCNLRRLAVGTIQAGVNAQAITWALLQVLGRMGLGVQTFGSQACFSPLSGASAITGRSARHLDSWLMPRDLCQAMFARGSRGADLALVEGRFKSSSVDTKPGATVVTLMPCGASAWARDWPMALRPALAAA